MKLLIDFFDCSKAGSPLLRVEASNKLWPEEFDEALTLLFQFISERLSMWKNLAWLSSA